jgi:hypothetical protein
MDADKILEKLMRWLSDPRGREMLKTIVYLVFPLIVLLMVRGAARRRATQKPSSTIQPKIRPATTESLTPTETFRETKIRHEKKMAQELQQAFGREGSILAKAKRAQSLTAKSKAAPKSESPDTTQKKMLQEELLKLFSRRPE